MNFIETLRSEAAKHRTAALILEETAKNLEKLSITISAQSLEEPAVAVPEAELIAAQDQQADQSPNQKSVFYTRPNVGVGRHIRKIIADKYLDKEMFNFATIKKDLESAFPRMTIANLYNVLYRMPEKYNIESIGRGHNATYMVTTVSVNKPAQFAK